MAALVVHVWKGFSIERYKGCREKERGMATLAVPVCILYNITIEESSRNVKALLHREIQSEQLVSCTLWEDYCLQFLEYLNECNSEGPIIILLTHARNKESQGSYPTTISNSLKASKLLINQPMSEIEEFKQRYRLEVMVYHKEECTNFLLWDRECANLIGQSDDEVNRLKIADGDVDLNVYLEALDKILGYTLAFKVKVQSKFRNFVVLKYSFDSDLINTTIDLLPDIEAPYKVHFPLSDTNDPLQYETQSLSATTDHDPLLEVPLTPTKQQTPQVLRGSTEFIDFTCSIFI
ncbi:hypothetical protein JHK87_049772 [Glycine soja]|nr:hypothetical protein JHK87_049772 [Glycine soja]